ncbi:hypothetical protein OOK41_13690 [Micromonospora sp. NBC_01655]|uniref:hypothetical protein n=1 Tax=Micromonospora sp. NBC_01655 TaxID=2975983 RepID=UPI002257254F|nr:hypothetical protein [Micromonospora sp. NBC_01655]MCX4471347.1 hypothetical protein [Micromonospora sp. NBC_01655]
MDATWGWLLAGGILIGAGLPITFVVLNLRAFADVAAGESGTASGFTNMLTTLGGATAVAMVAATGTFTGLSGTYAVVSSGVVAVLSVKRHQVSSNS